MNYATLYKRNTNGSIGQWTIYVEGNRYWVEYGQVGGILTKGNEVIVNGKNVGKKNETSGDEQALKEAYSIWKARKKSSNCVEDINDIDKLLFNPPMLAKVYNREYDDDMVFIQPKYDGIRCNMHYLVNDGIVESLSRRNNKFYSTGHIQDALRVVLSKFPSIHLDGELYNHELHDDFNKIVSIVKKQKLDESDLSECIKYIRYTIYDMWDDENPDMSYKERNAWIMKNLCNIPFIDIAPTFDIHSHDDAEKYFIKFVSEGYEGAIIRKDKSYEHKRSSNLLKYKEFMDDEFSVLSIHDGKKAGIAEYCWIDLKNGEKCKATLGFNDSVCKDIYSHRDELIGKMATVRFFGWTNDNHLRFPVVKIIDRDYE